MSNKEYLYSLLSKFMINLLSQPYFSEAALNFKITPL